MPFKRLFKDKYAGSSPENASVVRTLFDLLGNYFVRIRPISRKFNSCVTDRRTDTPSYRDARTHLKNLSIYSIPHRHGIELKYSNKNTFSPSHPPFFLPLFMLSILSKYFRGWIILQFSISRWNFGIRLRLNRKKRSKYKAELGFTLSLRRGKRGENTWRSWTQIARPKRWNRTEQGRIHGTRCA